METLLHASLFPIGGGRLSPRVPNTRTRGEDVSIPRICFSTTLENCIYSMPAGVLLMRNLMWMRDSKGIQPVLYLYVLEPNTYEQENLWTPKIIHSYVPDAELYKEHWIVGQDIVCREHIVSVEKYDCRIERGEDGRWAHTSIKKLETDIIETLPTKNSYDYLSFVEARLLASNAEFSILDVLSAMLLEEVL